MRLVLVTGGTGGIGRAVCHALAARALSPVVAYRTNERAARTIAAATGGHPLALDLGAPDAIDATIRDLDEIAGDLVGVAHCASPPPVPLPFGQITDEQLESFWRQNVSGPRRLLAGVVKRRLRPQRSGTIVAVLSQAMGHPLHGAAAGFGAYTISKYGLQGVLALLAADCPWLRVETVSPGFTETKMLEAFDSRFVDRLRREGRVAEPAAVARDIVSYFE